MQSTGVLENCRGYRKANDFVTLRTLKDDELLEHGGLRDSKSKDFLKNRGSFRDKEKKEVKWSLLGFLARMEFYLLIVHTDKDKLGTVLSHHEHNLYK